MRRTALGGDAGQVGAAKRRVSQAGRSGTESGAAARARAAQRRDRRAPQWEAGVGACRQHRATNPSPSTPSGEVRRPTSVASCVASCSATPASASMTAGSLIRRIRPVDMRSAISIICANSPLSRSSTSRRGPRSSKTHCWRCGQRPIKRGHRVCPTCPLPNASPFAPATRRSSRADTPPIRRRRGAPVNAVGASSRRRATCSSDCGWDKRRCWRSSTTSASPSITTRLNETRACSKLNRRSQGVSASRRALLDALRTLFTGSPLSPDFTGTVPIRR